METTSSMVKLLSDRQCRELPIYTSDNVHQSLAKIMCNGCPVMYECRRYGDMVERSELRIWFISGVYGGENGSTRSHRRELNKLAK